MNFSIIFAGLLVVIPFAHAAGETKSHIAPKEVLFTLTQKNIVRIDPGKDISKEKFYNSEWGQFELLIPKELFPIPAPNCRKNVMMGISGANPDKPGNEQKLEFRWRLFQSLHAVKEGKIAGITVPLMIKHSPGFSPYMLIDKQGNPVLEWCNVGIDERSMSKKPFTPAP